MWHATDVPQNMCHKSRGGENLLVILGKIIKTILSRDTDELYYNEPMNEHHMKFFAIDDSGIFI